MQSGHSTTVVSVINRLLPPGCVQKTFSARFDEAGSDEGRWMRLVTAARKTLGMPLPNLCYVGTRL